MRKYKGTKKGQSERERDGESVCVGDMGERARGRENEQKREREWERYGE